MKQETAWSHNLVPCPVEFSRRDGYFTWDADTSLDVAGGDRTVLAVAGYLTARLKAATGYDLGAPGEKRAASRISLSLLDPFDTTLGAEGYTLEVTPRQIEIQANTAQGLFYGCQTLLQWLPPEIESRSPVSQVDWRLPGVHIRDYPRFAWRGLLLDVSRHFFTKEEVLAYIDQLARYKFNVLHLHLTDDQGWRLEIQRYPRLTEIGAWRVPRTGSWWSFAPPQPGEPPTYGGFYTQADIREIVAYATARFVSIVPEIDVPGHSLAALAGYPELSCSGGPFAVNPGSKFYNEIANVLCAGNDQVFEFLDNVIAEAAALFPGQYIHMGGDEATKKFWKACPKCQTRMRELNIQTEEELQSYFVQRLEKLIEARGKRLIGWDEILEGGLSPHATVMSWRGAAGGIQAARMGHPVVMTPSPYYYLDLYQGEPVAEPETYSMCRLKSCYEFEPLPDGVDPQYILGGQGNLWTESVPDLRHAQYMTWPRGMAIAESLWSPAQAKNWPGFVARVEQQFVRLDAAQVKYARSLYDPFFTARRDDQGRLLVEIQTEVDDLDIHYTWAGTNPDPFYPRYEQPLTPPIGAKELRVITCRNGRPVGKEMVMPLAELHKRAPAKAD